MRAVAVDRKILKFPELRRLKPGGAHRVLTEELLLKAIEHQKTGKVDPCKSGHTVTASQFDRGGYATCCRCLMLIDLGSKEEPICRW